MTTFFHNHRMTLFSLFNIALILWTLSLVMLTSIGNALPFRVAGSLLVIGLAFITWYFHKTDSIWKIAATLICGTIGLIVGIGIGVWFLVAGDIGFQAITGLCGLAMSFVLLFAGTGSLLRKMRFIWRIPVTLAITLVIAVISWTIVPALMATHVPSTRPGPPPVETGFSARAVEFQSPDSVKLHAWYVPSKNGAAVVLRHGSGSTASDVFPQAAILVRHGYGVMITDARGHGLSEGKAMDFGWYGNEDIRGAVTFLTAQDNVDARRIAVVGLSMGGEEAIGAAATDNRIAAVITEGALARTDADKTWLADEFGWRGKVQVALEWVQYALADLLTEAEKPISLVNAAAAMSPRKVLLICAGNVPDEALAAEYIRTASPENVTIWVVSGASHTGGLATAPDEWESRVSTFLFSTIGP
jgi:uncharacterized protein